MLDVVCIDPITDQRWHTLVEQGASSVFHSPAWLRVIRDTYGFEVNAYLAVDATGAPQAGIPFCRLTDWRGTRLVSLPFCDYCDPLAADAETWQLLADRLSAEEATVVLRCLHNDAPLHDERFHQIKRAHWHGIDLSRDLDTIWQGLASGARRAINKAQRDGITVRYVRDRESLRAFFDMHLGIRKYKYRLVAQPYLFFEHIWRQFIEPGDGVLQIAEYDGKIIGGILYLRWKDTWFYKFNASNPDNLAHRPNDLMLWEGIQYAKAQGCTRWDFGLSDWDQEGLIRYKRKYATEEKTICFLESKFQSAPQPGADRMKQLLPRLTDLFTDASVPDAITERAGELLYGFFA